MLYLRLLFKARNDTLSFESVRSTFQVDEGLWFYEVTLITNGIMQIGFANKSATFINHVKIKQNRGKGFMIVYKIHNFNTFLARK